MYLIKNNDPSIVMIGGTVTKNIMGLTQSKVRSRGEGRLSFGVPKFKLNR